MRVKNNYSFFIVPQPKPAQAATEVAVPQGQSAEEGIDKDSGMLEYGDAVDVENGSASDKSAS
jgi:hypothetical protein